MGNRVFTDTTDFFAIDYGDEINVGGKRYTVMGHERERRFGIEDPKFWVKRVGDTETGEKKIIKLSFFESFETSLGGVKIRCFRDPDKESDILDFVRGHPAFMQGVSCKDFKGNTLRILDIVRGPNFFNHIDTYRMPHKKYFFSFFPQILSYLIEAFEAIRLLHDRGFKHGDIRNDHLIVPPHNNRYVWIDFDYDFEATENPFALDIFGLGNILLYAAGRGFHNYYMIKHDTADYGDLIQRLSLGDFSILNRSRLMNVKKLYPYVPTALNDILMHFSLDATIYYERVEEIIADMTRCLRTDL